MADAPRSTLQCVGNACGTAAAAVRNYGVYPAGRAVRNYVLPAAGQTALALGRGVRNTALPAAGQAALALGRGVRNYAIYPAGNAMGRAARGAWNATRRCVGAACARGVARARARLGWAANFTPGYEITANDRGVVQGIIDAHNPELIANRKEELAVNLGQRISDHMLDNDIEPSVEAYTAIATNDMFSGDIKGLYMLNLAQMGRDVEAPNVPTATHIAMQANEGAADAISYDNTEAEDLAAALAALQAAGNHQDGGRRNRKNRKNSRKTKTRKHRKNKNRKY